MSNVRRCVSSAGGMPLPGSCTSYPFYDGRNGGRSNDRSSDISPLSNYLRNPSFDPTLKAKNASDESRAPLTPTSFQQSLCLNATSDADVSLTDEEMCSSPEGVWLRGAGAATNGFVAPACSRKQSIVDVLVVPAFAGWGAGGGARRAATFSAAGGGTCVCGGTRPLFSKSQLKTKAAAFESSQQKTENEANYGGKSTKKFSLGDPGANFDRISNISFPSKSTPITDEYRVTHEIIGVGESGRVMACFSRVNGQKYALKVLRDGSRSRREVYLHYLTSKHENIVSIIDIFENTFEDVKCLLIVVEFLEGGDLLTHFEKQGRFPYAEKDVARIISQLASAVKYLHDMNIAHRDIKLENILCSSSDIQTCTYKLGDFGFAKRSDCNKLMESPCCTPTYVCPEILSHERYNKSCDMWAIGVVMYILLCGYPPFYSMKGLPFSPGMRERITIGLYAFPPDDWDHISEAAKNVIRNLLRTDPATRATVNEVLNSEFLRRFTADENNDTADVSSVGLKTIWSGSSLSSLDDYRTAASSFADELNEPGFFTSASKLQKPEDLSADDSALGYSSADPDTHDDDDETTTDEDSEGYNGKLSAFRFPPSSKSRTLKMRSECRDEMTTPKKFSLGANRSFRSTAAGIGVAAAAAAPLAPAKCRVNAAAPPLLPHHSMSARCLDAAGERRVAANAGALAARSARLCSIQEEVNRALDLMRLRADDVVLVQPRNAVGNSLLERRRNRVISAKEKVH